MIKNDAQYGRPFVDFTDTKSNIEALTGLVGGETAYAVDAGESGHYDFVNSIWVWNSRGGSIPFVVDGVLAVVENAPSAYVFTAAATISNWYVYLKTTGSAGSSIFDIHLNGTTIFTTQDNRPTVAYDDANGWMVATPDVTDFAAGDVLTFDIDQIATGAADVVCVGGAIGGGDGGGGISDAPSNDIYYGRRNAGWTDLKVYFDTLYSTLASMSAANALDLTDGGEIALHTHAGGKISFSAAVTTEGKAQNRNTASAYSYQEQPTILYRPIRLISVQWDIRVAGDYTLSIRDENGTVIEDIIVVGIGAASADNLFALASPRILQAGAYRLRMTENSGSVLWSDYGTPNVYYPAWNTARSIIYGGSAFNFTAPFDLNFNDSTVSE